MQYESLQIGTKEYNTAMYSRVGRAQQCIAAYRTVHYIHMRACNESWNCEGHLEDWGELAEHSSV